MITSPYNFVPLNKEVVMPFWAEQVSNDIPFENGVSGVLNLKIKAESPIYVRNGVLHNATENEKNNFNRFRNIPFIPATSVKGMLRSVMEIMSYGRMANKVDDNRYSVRDFQNTDIYPKKTFSKDILCGWLEKRTDGEYYLQNCGRPGRIDQRNLGSTFLAFFDEANKFDKVTNLTGFNKNKSYHKSAKLKDDKFGNLKDTITQFDFERNDNGRDIYNVGTKDTGKLVFTGQPDFNSKSKTTGKNGKHYEFVFLAKTTPFEKVDEQVIKNFFFAYFDHDKPQQQEDWKWRKPQLDGGEPIPVFFRKDGAKIKDMGLSFLYKIIYKQSIKDAINNTQTNAASYDLAETIFGYAEKETALKGRVHIGHAFLQNGIQPLPQERAVLSGPKASYYPNYVEQKTTNGGVSKYWTFMDSTSEIRGWKRYPVRNNGVIPNINNQNDRITTSFIPLNKGAEFIVPIHYHNLREEELGALISAITFHNTEGVYHSIGMAKPLGYGKVSLSIENLDENKKRQYLKAYETFMDYALNNSTPLWFQSLQIKELFAMAKGSPNDAVDKQLVYMPLDGFANNKGARGNTKSALQKFSIIANSAVYVTSLTSAADIAKAKSKFEKEKVAFSAADNNETLEQQTKAKYENELKAAFEAKKSELLALLNTKRQEQKQKEDAIREEERLKKREEKNTEGAQADLIFTRFECREVLDVVKKHGDIYKVKQLTDKQTEQFKNALTTSYKSIKSPKKDDWLKKNQKITEFPWTKIEEWLGKDITKALHSEFMGLNLY